MEDLKPIEEALNIAASRGCFNLQDSAILFSKLNAIKQRLQALEDPEAKSIPGGGHKPPKEVKKGK